MSHSCRRCGSWKILQRSCKISRWRCKFAQWNLRTEISFCHACLDSSFHERSNSFCNACTSFSVRQVRPKPKFSQRRGQNRGSNGRSGSSGLWIFLYFLSVVVFFSARRECSRSLCSDCCSSHHLRTFAQMSSHRVWGFVSLSVLTCSRSYRMTCLAHAIKGILMLLL